MNVRAGVAVREQAASALAEIGLQGRSLRAALAARLPQLADSRDRALLEAIVFATCRAWLRYEPVLGQLLQRPLPPRHGRIRALLLSAMAQLDSLGLPAHSTIDCCAEVARSWGLPAYVGLVNALLRRFQREREALLAAACREPVAQFAHPSWLIAGLQADWPEHWTSILAANDRQAPLWLRVNRRRQSADDYRQQLAAAGFEAATLAHWPLALRLDTSLPPTRLPGWENGAVSIQDAAAQAVVGLLAAEPGMRVLDACAAPGGKTAALLEAVDELDLWALDIDAVRVARLGQGLDRLGLSCTVQVADAAQPEHWWDGRPFERILLDVPCSATGVIRRQPDIKLHRRAADIDALQQRQAALLQACWPLLAPGGRLLYTTCSLLRAENGDSIEAFLAGQPAARALALPEWLGHAAGPGRQRLPGEQGMDGFYYAVLQRD